MKPPLACTTNDFEKIVERVFFTGIPDDAKKKSVDNGSSIHRYFSVFRNNRGHKSADLVISEPGTNTSLFQSLTTGMFFLLDYYLVLSITCHHCPYCT